MRPTKWTEAAIKQAFDDFIKKHDRLPTKQEMYGKYNGQFPRPLSVKITLGITLGEYLNKNYTVLNHRCQSRIYNKISKEYWLNNFKTQYIQLGMPPKEQYDKCRARGTPNSKTLTRIADVPTWSALLDICGFVANDRHSIACEMPFDETEENYKKLIEKLQMFLPT